MNQKKFKIIFCLLLTLFFISTIFYCATPINADDSMPTLTIPDLQVTIPGVVFDKTTSGNWIGDYIAGIYKYSIGIVGILSAVILMIAGIIWLTAGGNASQITEAKAWITASLTGLIIALSSYTILYTVNPDLLNLKPLNIKSIERESFIREQKNLAARRSGLDICEIKSEGETYPGTKLNVIDSKIKTGGDWWSKANDFVFGAIFDAILNPEAYTCSAYCKAGGFCNGANCIKYVKVLKVIDDNNSVICCTCEKPIRLDRDSLIEKIKNLYGFDNGIIGQRGDASIDLLNFLDCMAPKIPKEINQISSISDSHQGGDLRKCNTSRCIRCDTNGKPSGCCQHACQSCHYGGGETPSESYAVDFGNGGKDRSDSINSSLTNAANQCGAKFINIESNHIHISVPPCAKN